MCPQWGGLAGKKNPFKRPKTPRDESFCHVEAWLAPWSRATAAAGANGGAPANTGPDLAAGALKLGPLEGDPITGAFASLALAP